MSKAFTREDDIPDPIITRRLPDPVPPGGRNYLTADGARRLRMELDRYVIELSGSMKPTRSADG